MCALLPMGSGGNYSVHDSDLKTSLRALLERVMFSEKAGPAPVPPPQPKAGVFRERLGKFAKRVARSVGPLEPVSTPAVLGLFRAKVRQRYEQAGESLERQGLRRSDAYISAFVKVEKVRFSAAKPDPAPRLIQPRGPRYNLRVARFLKPHEHAVYRGVAEVWGSDVVVAKGLNAHQRAVALHRKWSTFTDPVAVGLDASRFDQHVSVPALRWEHGLYVSLFRRSAEVSELRQLLEWQVRNRGWIRCADGTIRYEIDGCRMSGDMNTALGNCVLMCAMMWAYTRELGVRAELLNDGDDCVLMVEREDLGAVERSAVPWFRDMGFVMKVEPAVDVFEKIEFCQASPVRTPRGWVLVRNPSAVVYKDQICFRPVRNAAEWDTRRGAIAACGAALSDGVPVMAAYYRYLGRGVPDGKLRRGQPETGMDYLALGMDDRSVVPDAEARVSFWRAFGVTPTEQLALEERLDSLVPTYAPTTPYDQPSTIFDFLL